MDRAIDHTDEDNPVVDSADLQLGLPELGTLTIPVVRKQIQLLDELFEHPPLVDFREGAELDSLDEQARAGRVAELESRLTWLTLIRKVTDGELELLTRAERELRGDPGRAERVNA